MQTKNKTIMTIIGLTFSVMAVESAMAEPHHFGNHGQHAQQRHEAAKEHREQWQKKSPEERSAKREEMHQRFQNKAPEEGKARLRDPGVNQRQANQHERIEQGIHSGQLTKGEAKQLATEQRAIRQEERQYKSDGVLTKDERKDLHQDLNAASKDIYSEKHDAEHR